MHLPKYGLNYDITPFSSPLQLSSLLTSQPMHAPPSVSSCGTSWPFLRVSKAAITTAAIVKVSPDLSGITRVVMSGDGHGVERSESDRPNDELATNEATFLPPPLQQRSPLPSLLLRETECCFFSSFSVVVVSRKLPFALPTQSSPTTPTKLSLLSLIPPVKTGTRPGSASGGAPRGHRGGGQQERGELLSKVALLSPPSLSRHYNGNCS